MDEFDCNEKWQQLEEGLSRVMQVTEHKTKEGINHKSWLDLYKYVHCGVSNLQQVLCIDG